MKKTHLFSLLFTLLLLYSCKEANNNSTETNKDETAQKEDNSDNSKSRKSKDIDGSVAPLIQTNSFFSKVKDAKSGTEGEVSVMVKSSYEYIEKDGKEVLDGKACVDMVGMGFGMRDCATFKEGNLQGVAYRTASTPATYMLRIEFDNNQLSTASFYVYDETCLGYGPIKGKSITELENEFAEIMKSQKDETKFKTVDCPKEVEELFK